MMHDYEPQEIAPLTGEPRASKALLLFLIVLFATAFVVNEVDWQTSTYVDYVVTPDQAEDQVDAGKSSRKIVYVMIGMVGLLMFAVPGRQRFRFANLPVALLCVYVLVCIASVLWTDAPWLTIKRLGIAIFGLLATFGAARHLSPRDVIDAALGIGTVLIAVSLYAELRLGTFAPLAGEYRFAGIMHPNAQGSICGLMVIAAFFGIKASERGKLIYFGLLLLAGVFLVLTKSRTSFGACLIGVWAAWYLVASRSKQILLGFGLPAAVCAGLIVLLLLDAELSSGAASAASFGRAADEDLLSFNGRVPVWVSLLDYIAARPLLGYGYQGFWTGDRIYEVSLGLDWAPASAHSVFFDVLLNTGLLGGAIFGLGVIVTFRSTIKRCVETMAPTDGFVFALLVYAFVSSFFESGFSQPNGFEPFIIGAALLHVMSRRTETDDADGATSRRADPLSNWKAVSAGGLA